MKGLPVVFAGCVLIGTIVSGCNSSKSDAPAPASQAHNAPSMGQMDVSYSGKVTETMDSGGYTYVCLENNGKKTWFAVPSAKVKVGQQLTCLPGGEMKNFTSKTLNRTFDSIIFSSGIQ